MVNENYNFNEETSKCGYFTLEEYKEIKGLTLVHYNCGRLNDKNRLKFADIKKNIISEHLSIFCLSETWLTDDDDTGDFLIPGFSSFRQDRNFEICKSSGGGLLTYVKNNLSADDKCYSHLNINQFELECQFISIKKKHCKEIIVVNCYRCPDNKTIESRQTAIDKLLSNIKSITNYQHKSFIINGDLNFNTDTTNINENSNSTHTSDYIEKICLELGLVNLITENTCFRDDSSSTLDLILTNLSNISKQGIIHYSHFDHCPVFVSKKTRARQY